MTIPQDWTFGGWRACDECGEAIASPADAGLTVSPEVLEERRAGLAEAARAKAAGEQAPRASSGLVPWNWAHLACIPPRDEEYVVAGDRVDTLPEALARTLELLDRPWFLETAWEDALRRFYPIPFE